MSLLLLIASACGLFADEPKGTPVKLDKLESIAPAVWIVEKPANRLRSHQFRLPKAEGDKADAGITILPDAKGTPDTNFARIRAMFIPPEGMTNDQLGKVEKFHVGTAKVAILDVSGDCLYKEQPFNPKEKEVLIRGFRYVSVFFETDDGTYHIRFTGPEKTVGKYKAGFDSWLRAFK